MGISGYVPFYNNAATVLAAVDSLRRQDPPLDEVFAVDDGSTDCGAELLKASGVRVLRQPDNLGRGAARRRAMEEARYEFVLCCDATNVLPPSFIARALPWFQDSTVAAVFGRITQPAAGGAVHRWRGRHLFRVSAPSVITTKGSLATYGAMVRRSVIIEVGNYNEQLRHTEDADLGSRLLSKGCKVVFDPALEAISVANNSLAQVLERYWRWHAGPKEDVSFADYSKAIWYSMRAMMPADLRERDLTAAGISFFAPHYQFWRSVLRRRRRHWIT